MVVHFNGVIILSHVWGSCLLVWFADTLADLTIFFQGKESDQFGKWWHEMKATERRNMIVKARNLLWTVSDGAVHWHDVLWSGLWFALSYTWEKVSFRNIECLHESFSRWLLWMFAMHVFTFWILNTMNTWQKNVKMQCQSCYVRGIQTHYMYLITGLLSHDDDESRREDRQHGVYQVSCKHN